MLAEKTTLHNLRPLVEAGSLAEAVLPPVSTSGLLVNLVLGAVLGVVVSWGWGWYRRDDEVVEFADVLDEVTCSAGEQEREVLAEAGDVQQSVVAPEAIEWETRAARRRTVDVDAVCGVASASAPSPGHVRSSTTNPATNIVATHHHRRYCSEGSSPRVRPKSWPPRPALCLDFSQIEAFG